MLGAETATTLRDRLPGDDRLSLTELGRELRQPSFVVGALAVGLRRRRHPDALGRVPRRRVQPAAAGIRDRPRRCLRRWLEPGGLRQHRAAGALHRPGRDGRRRSPSATSHLAAGVLVFGAFLAGSGASPACCAPGASARCPGRSPGWRSWRDRRGAPSPRAPGWGRWWRWASSHGRFASRWPGPRAPERAGWPEIAATAWVTALVGARGTGRCCRCRSPPSPGLALITPKEPGPWRPPGCPPPGRRWPSRSSCLGSPSPTHAYLSAGARPSGTRSGCWCRRPAGPGVRPGFGPQPAGPGRRLGWCAHRRRRARRPHRLVGPGCTVELAGMASPRSGSPSSAGVTLEVIIRDAPGHRLAPDPRRGRCRRRHGVVVSTVLVFLPGRAGLPRTQLTDALRFTSIAEGNPDCRGSCCSVPRTPSRGLPRYRGSRLPGHLGAGAAAVGDRPAAVAAVDEALAGCSAP